MNIKNVLCAMLAITAASPVSMSLANSQNLEELLRNSLEGRRMGLLSDTTKTPTTPDVIWHNPNIKGPNRSFYRKRIYFGTDESGNPCYERIGKHENDNPAFGEVRLAVFHPAAVSWNPWAEDSFEILGTYADKKKRNVLISSIAARGGVWCPKLNAIIGGSSEVGQTEDQQCICDRFVEFENQPKRPSRWDFMGAVIWTKYIREHTSRTTTYEDQEKKDDEVK